jgi:tetratricopeptide (TPR) repeat protein
MRKELLDRALSDYETAYRLQEPYLDRLSSHARGELLLGLADAYESTGQADRARQYFEKAAALMPETPYGRNAKIWLETGVLSARQRGCLGCHTSSTQ